MTVPEYVSRIASEYGGRLRVRSALNPVLWLCGIIGIPIILALNFSSRPHPAMVYLLFIVIGVALLSFLFLLFWDRDRLQSEDYQLRKQTLELIETKGDMRPIDATVVQVISDPSPPTIGYNDCRIESEGEI